MASVRKRLEQAVFGLYFVIVAVGTAMEAIAQIVAR